MNINLVHNNMADASVPDFVPASDPDSVPDYENSISVTEQRDIFTVLFKPKKNETVGGLFKRIAGKFQNARSDIGNFNHLDMEFKILNVSVGYIKTDENNVKMNDFMKSGGILSPDDDRPLHEIGVGPGVYIDIKVINP